MHQCFTVHTEFRRVNPLLRVRSTPSANVDNVRYEIRWEHFEGTVVYVDPGRDAGPDFFSVLKVVFPDGREGPPGPAFILKAFNGIPTLMPATTDPGSKLGRFTVHEGSQRTAGYPLRENQTQRYSIHPQWKCDHAFLRVRTTPRTNTDNNVFYQIAKQDFDRTIVYINGDSDHGSEFHSVARVVLPNGQQKEGGWIVKSWNLVPTLIAEPI